MTQAEPATKLCTTQDTISLWELEKRFPDIFNVVKLADLFDVSTGYLLDNEK